MEDMDCSSSAEPVINILLLGQSGVGKSTFINTSFNYLKYKTFEDFLKNDAEILIPAKFEISDKNFVQKTVEIGVNKDRNEILEPGQAATQNAKSYIFDLSIENKNYKIRFLDTPGIGDRRGSKQDEINCDLILSYISQFKTIHAFCILLQPNNPRLDVFLNYCVLQILSRLDVGATKNLLFVFTNTRGENFTPGKTYEPLNVFIENVRKERNVDIPLSKDNMFCFDNEAFRFATALSKGVDLMTDFVYESTNHSWNQSSVELWRFLKYATQLPAHSLANIITINDAKSMALNLTQPTTEIVEIIDDNLKLINEHCNELSNAKLTKEDLIRKMNIPRIDIKARKLEEPQTVCSHPSCLTVYNIKGVPKIHYKQKCCLGCMATFVTPDVRHNPVLYVCSAFTWTSSCRVCKHNLGFHQHIYYETEVYEKTYDNSMMPNINSQEDLIKFKEECLRKLNDEQKELEYEKKYILESCVMFDNYLTDNSIAPIGKPIHDYLEYQLKRECSLDQKDASNKFNRIMTEYQNSASAQTRNCLAQDVEDRTMQLLNLKHFGLRIKELYDIQRMGTNRGYENRETPVPVVQKDWFQQIQQLIAFGGTALQMAKIFFSRTK